VGAGSNHRRGEAVLGVGTLCGLDVEKCMYEERRREEGGVIFAKILKNKKYLLATGSKIDFHELESGDLLDTVYLTDSCLNRFSWIEEIAPGMIAFWGIRTSLSVYDCNSNFFVLFNLPKVWFFKWDVLGPRKVLVSDANSDVIFFLSLHPSL
jgi:hypothetical protein